LNWARGRVLVGLSATVALCGVLLVAGLATTRSIPSKPSRSPPFPRIATMYSKGGEQNTLTTQAAIARFNLYVADMINWPVPSAADPSLTQGEYYKRQNAGLTALMYFHACLYSDTEYTPDQFTINGTRYYIDPGWYLTYAGSFLTRDLNKAETRVGVQDTRAFAVGDRIMLGGGPRQSRAELAIVSSKSATAGPGELIVTRGVLSQHGRFPSINHYATEYVRPVAHAFGSGAAMLLNPTQTAPSSDVNPQLGRQTWNQFVAAFLGLKLHDPAFASIDGYMLDNLVDRASALVDAPERVDLSNTNMATGISDSTWSEGMQDLVVRVRASLPPDQVLVANDGGHPTGFDEYLSGGTIEGIDQHGFAAMHGPVEGALSFYWSWMSDARRPQVFLFDGSPRIVGLQAAAAQYQALRFLLTLALTDNGYFVFDDFNVDDSHQTVWWYDEYDNAGQQTGYLGQPLGAAFQPAQGVYRRDFEHGISLTNTTDSQRQVDLGGVFHKIHGRQDPSVNDGSSVSSVSLPPRDGLILLRPAEIVAH